jgi:hypothetical protein
MKFWEKLSKTIYKLLARETLQKFRAHSLERVLKDAIGLLDTQALAEIKTFVKKQQTATGGFADKGGNSDVYYTLFGCYIAGALDIPETTPLLGTYVEKLAHTENLEGVYLHSAAILYAKCFGNETFPLAFRKKIHHTLLTSEQRQAGYTNFLNLMTFYYLEDYPGLYRVQKQLRAINTDADMPCPVTAARLVLQHCFGQPTQNLEKQLHSFYRGNGDFAATHKTPIGDLLSTAVALYALRFVNADLRIIKPDCLSYIDSLFSEGGFCATVLDTSPDVEYTFYGLLALGALSD